MSKLTEIKERIEKLPQRKREADIGNYFALYSADMEGVRSRLSRAIASAVSANSVPSFADADYAEVRTLADQAARSALGLATKIKTNFEFVIEKSCEARILTIKGKEDIASKRLKDIWQRKIQIAISVRRKLVDAATKMRLNDSGRLTSIINELEMHRNNAPESQSDVGRLGSLLNEFNEMITKIGLSDEISAFFEQASSEAGAESTAIDAPAIREFLDKWNVWSLFRIRIQ